jgi:DNA-binding transcriptional LysR family regulator
LIDVQRLLVLREVAHAGSFAGAATALRRTPSAVSQQIAALERGVGVPLVERSTRGIVLTEAGRLLLAAADAVHAELQTAARQLRDLQANGPQTLTVTTFASAGEPLLAPALTELTTAAGTTIDVTVIEAEPDDALASLRSGGADLALVYHFHTRLPPGHWPATAGVGVALIPRLGLPDNPRVRDLGITPQPIRYVGIYRPRRRWRHPAAARLLAALRHQAATLNSR